MRAHRASLPFGVRMSPYISYFPPHVSHQGCVRFLLTRLAVTVIPAEIRRKSAQAKDYFGEIAAQEMSFPPVTLFVLLLHSLSSLATYISERSSNLPQFGCNARRRLPLLPDSGAYSFRALPGDAVAVPASGL